MSDEPARIFTGRALGPLDGVLLIAGIGLLIALVAQLGAAEVAAQLNLVGWGVLLVFGQEILAYGANSAGWWLAFRRPRPALPMARLLEARIVGDAVNYLTPTAGLGGEVVRVRCLRDLASPVALAASVSVAKLTQLAGQILFLAVGLAAVLPFLDLDAGLRLALGGGIVVVTVLVVGLGAAQRQGMFAPWLGRLRRLGFVREHPRLAGWLVELDAEIAAIHRRAGTAMLGSTLVFALGWALGLLEMAIMLWLLGIEVTLSRVVVIEVLSIAFDSLLFFVPAKAGTQEAGKVMIFALLGLDPAQGLALGILRRLRELGWAGVGMVLWWRRVTKRAAG